VRTQAGFTLIELMIVVAIIGILSAIAIPNLLAMQIRSKRAELPMNCDAIRTAEIAYHAEWGNFTSAPATPPSPSGRNAVAFTGGGFQAYEMLGWEPDGLVRGSYAAVASNASNPQSDDFTATAQGDIDGDANLSEYMATRARKPVMLTQNTAY
jgi:type IV pilus assembly protein PilA